MYIQTLCAGSVCGSTYTCGSSYFHERKKGSKATNKARQADNNYNAGHNHVNTGKQCEQ